MVLTRWTILITASHLHQPSDTLEMLLFEALGTPDRAEQGTCGLVLSRTLVNSYFYV